MAVCFDTAGDARARLRRRLSCRRRRRLPGYERLRLADLTNAARGNRAFLHNAWHAALMACLRSGVNQRKKHYRHYCRKTFGCCDWYEMAYCGLGRLVTGHVNYFCVHAFCRRNAWPRGTRAIMAAGCVMAIIVWRIYRSERRHISSARCWPAAPRGWRMARGAAAILRR